MSDRFCLYACVTMEPTKDKGVLTMTYEDLRKKLLDYYGTATGPFPAAWGDVLRVERADNEELLELAREAGISTYGLEEDD